MTIICYETWLPQISLFKIPWFLSDKNKVYYELSLSCLVRSAWRKKNLEKKMAGWNPAGEKHTCFSQPKISRSAAIFFLQFFQQMFAPHLRKTSLRSLMTPKVSCNRQWYEISSVIFYLNLPWLTKQFSLNFPWTWGIFPPDLKLFQQPTWPDANSKNKNAAMGLT